MRFISGRAIVKPFRFLSIGGKPNLEFWFTQAVILLSTMLGVYLASFAGFEIAVNFDRYQRLSDARNLEISLRAEVSDNITKVEQWVISYKDGPMLWHDSRFAPRESYKLEDVIWLTMRNSSTTFELAPETLTSIRRFYSAVEQNKTVLFQQTQSNALAKKAIKNMALVAKEARTEILGKMDDDIVRLDAELKKVLD
ncbi:hypothetical protein WH95_02895 [Kiloniella litopenaei]|uniref:Uncharacterized protein n=1 Tax=Kiloniella litopenaei TaxID=1549748 RepID=A0A0M2R9E4_9PROT|nr:hypothetical protein [Kiloniella litopenaei]KKJ78276.1 hypothetical protein WH95_02895 [Kiloniella litopenaei]